jgi:peptidoglycan/LPS O-acetylase OafA/YrhL
MDRLYNLSIAISIGLLTWYSNRGTIREFLCSRTLIFLGEISYPLYLIHNNLGRYVVTQVVNLTNNTWVGVASGIMSVIMLATFLTFQVDTPIRKYLQQSLK